MSQNPNYTGRGKCIGRGLFPCKGELLYFKGQPICEEHFKYAKDCGGVVVDDDPRKINWRNRFYGKRDAYKAHQPTEYGFSKATFNAQTAWIKKGNKQ